MEGLIPEINERRSIRGWADKPVEAEKVKRVVEAGRVAPTARNTLLTRVICVRKPETRAQFTDICKAQKFVADAPVILVVCAGNIEYRMSCGQPGHSVNGAIAATNMMLQAVHEGLGTCWVGGFYEDKVRELLKIPADWRPVAILPLGYPSEEALAAHRKDKLPMDQFLMEEEWTQTN